ncbi:MAG: hypothetical protein H0T52_12580 [Lautropia sp.]|nr:hypothetical protein [Lautropia sp.]
MQFITPSGLLKKALAADAVASGALAILQLAMPDALGRQLLLPRALLFETGVFLVFYTVLLVVLARSPRVWAGLITFVVIGNVGWAIGCAWLPTAGNPQPSALGVAYLAMQAAAVLVFATLEYRGLRSSVAHPGFATSSAP